MRTIITILLLSLSLFANAQRRMMVNGFKHLVSGGGPTVGYYTPVTVDFTKVPSTQTNFVMLYADTLTDLKTVGNSGFVQNSSGHDIRFYAADGVTQLSHEIEKYVPSTGEIWAWVKVPSLSSSVATVIRIYYGDASITTFQGSVPGSVYDANYQAVWHMKETLTGAGQTVADATTNAFNLTSVSTWGSGKQQAGKIGGALLNSKTNGDYLSFTAKTFNTDYTISAWTYVGVLDQHSTILGHTSTSNDLNFFNGHLGMFNGSGNDITSDSVTAQFVWTYHVITRTGTAMKIYHNGILAQSSTNGSNSRVFNSLGRNQTEVSEDMIRDETRFSNTVRSADWILTEYRNQNSPFTFFTVGTKVTL